MLDFIHKLWETDSLSPHGICLLWRPELVWTHVISDALIGMCYFSIPIALVYFVSKRRDVDFGWIFWSFAAFILACGTTHFFSILTLWIPSYGIEGLVKAFTAAASITTAVALWHLLPKAIALPSPTQLRLANQALKARVAERDQALDELEKSTSERLRIGELLREAQRREADAALQDNQEWLRVVSDTAAVGLVVIDERHRIRFANRAYAVLFNIVSHDVCGFHAQELHEEMYDRFLRDRLVAAFRDGRASYETVHEADGGSANIRHLVETYEPSRSATGDLVVTIVITDVTQLKRSEVELRANRDLLQSVMDGTVDAIFAKDAAGRYVAVNETGARFLGRSREDIIGKDNDELFGPTLAKPFNDQDHEVMINGGPVVAEQMLLVAGCPRYFVVTKRPWAGPNRMPAGVVGITRDVTEQHLIAEERAEIAKRLLRAQEDERLRIARELHDQVGQDLTGLSMGLKALESDVISPDGRSRLGWLRDLTVQVSRNLHRTARELRPTSLDDLGLHDAISSQIAEWNHRLGSQIEVYLEDLKLSTLSPDAELTVYRCIQEAITNIIKHAKATNVSVVAKRGESDLRLIIEDNGVGFDTSQKRPPSDTGGLGIIGMRERLSHVNGTLHIESSYGLGTSIYILIRDKVEMVNLLNEEFPIGKYVRPGVKHEAPSQVNMAVDCLN